MTNFIDSHKRKLITAKKQDFIIVGELHGIEENAKIMEELIEIFLELGNEKIIIALEWSLTIAEKNDIRDFINNQIDKIKTPPFFFTSDGRVTKTHIELLLKIRALNKTKPEAIMIDFFDNANTEKPEETLANRLEAIRNKNKTSDVILVEAGCFHADKLGSDEISPFTMAGILARNYNVFSIFLSYLSGETFLEDKIYSVNDSATQQLGAGEGFDEIIVIEKATLAMSEILLAIEEG